MSSFTIDAILGKRQKCAAVTTSTVESSEAGNSDEEKRDGNIGKFLSHGC